MTARESALMMLMRINEDGVLCHKALASIDRFGLTEADRALSVRLTHGTLERMLTLDTVITGLCKKPVTKLKPVIRNVLRLSAYQMLYLVKIPDSAAVNEAVKLTKKHGYSFLSGFVNGVLRSLSREKKRAGSAEDYLSEVGRFLSKEDALCFRYSFPKELCDYFLKEYPAETEEMLSAFLSDGVTAIRLNKSRGNAAELESALKRDGISYTKGILPNTFRITKSGDISKTKAFAEGLFSIQDESSALAGNILPLKAGMRVLDLCAAPGGKSIHIADELTALGGGSVTARDVSDGKCARIREHADRVRLDNVICETADATLRDETAALRYDLVIADLPCSGLGVIGRKPDIKWKTKRADIDALAALQKEILKNAVSYVKPGGYLCYSTCTITKEENAGGSRFLTEAGLRSADFSERIPEPFLKRYDNGCLQLFPQDGTDGFYIALYQKEA